jgi:hypothetical protein
MTNGDAVGRDCPPARRIASGGDLIGFEPIQDSRIYIEKINEPFLYKLKGTPAEYKAGLRDREGLGRAARERHLRPVHRGRRGAVCLKQAAN